MGEELCQVISFVGEAAGRPAPRRSLKAPIRRRCGPQREGEGEKTSPLDTSVSPVQAEAKTNPAPKALSLFGTVRPEGARPE